MVVVYDPTAAAAVASTTVAVRSTGHDSDGVEVRKQTFDEHLAFLSSTPTTH